jgi:hypothetical protein
MSPDQLPLIYALDNMTNRSNYLVPVPFIVLEGLIFYVFSNDPKEKLCVQTFSFVKCKISTSKYSTCTDVHQLTRQKVEHLGPVSQYFHR